MRYIVSMVMVVATLLLSWSTLSVPARTIRSVLPSSSGKPNSVVSLRDYEFVSVQGTGQIFTYSMSGKSLAPVGVYATPCKYPSGMVLANIGGTDVMAVVCYDGGSLLTLKVHADGSLSGLGAVSGLAMPYPGIALDGTNVLVPLFGSGSANGAVAKLSIAEPSKPVITGTASLESPAPGEFVNPGYLAVADGHIFVTAGSESPPKDESSTVQVVSEATMTVVGGPLSVPHSPQQIAVQGGVAYVTFFDATELMSLDISNPASLRTLQIASTATMDGSCHGIPVAVRDNFAYVGCYAEGVIDQFDISDPKHMRLTESIAGVSSPQRLEFAGNDLLVPSAEGGGRVYAIDVSRP